MALMLTMVASAVARPNYVIRSDARVMTNRMALNLHLSKHQASMVYGINLRYASAVDNPRNSVSYWSGVRNQELRRVLTVHQYNRYRASSHAHWAPVHHHHHRPVVKPHHHHHHHHHYHHRY